MTGRRCTTACTPSVQWSNRTCVIDRSRSIELGALSARRRSGSLCRAGVHLSRLGLQPVLPDAFRTHRSGGRRPGDVSESVSQSATLRSIALVQDMVAEYCVESLHRPAAPAAHGLVVD